MAQENDRLLERLVDAGVGVEFVLVGGVAANLHGSSFLTRDLGWRGATSSRGDGGDGGPFWRSEEGAYSFVTLTLRMLYLLF